MHVFGALSQLYRVMCLWHSVFATLLYCFTSAPMLRHCPPMIVLFSGAERRQTFWRVQQRGSSTGPDKNICRTR